MKGYAHAFAHHPALREIGPKVRDIHELVWQLLEGNPSLKSQWVWPASGHKVT